MCLVWPHVIRCCLEVFKQVVERDCAVSKSLTPTVNKSKFVMKVRVHIYETMLANSGIFIIEAFAD